MRVSTVLSKKRDALVSLPPSASVAVAAKLMSHQGLGAILIQTRDGTLLGILSERDIIFAAADLGKNAFGLKVEDLMTRDVKTCRSQDEVQSVIRTMSIYHIRHVPVIDNGRVVGMISVRDVDSKELMEKDLEISSYLAQLRMRVCPSGYFL